MADVEAGAEADVEAGAVADVETGAEAEVEADAEADAGERRSLRESRRPGPLWWRGQTYPGQARRPQSSCNRNSIELSFLVAICIISSHTYIILYCGSSNSM